MRRDCCKCAHCNWNAQKTCRSALIPSTVCALCTSHAPSWSHSSLFFTKTWPEQDNSVHWPWPSVITVTIWGVSLPTITIVTMIQYNVLILLSAAGEPSLCTVQLMPTSCRSFHFNCNKGKQRAKVIAFIHFYATFPQSRCVEKSDVKWVTFSGSAAVRAEKLLSCKRN